MGLFGYWLFSLTPLLTIRICSQSFIYMKLQNYKNTKIHSIIPSYQYSVSWFSNIPVWCLVIICWPHSRTESCDCSSLWHRSLYNYKIIKIPKFISSFQYFWFPFPDFRIYQYHICLSSVDQRPSQRAVIAHRSLTNQIIWPLAILFDSLAGSPAFAGNCLCILAPTVSSI